MKDAGSGAPGDGRVGVYGGLHVGAVQVEERIIVDAGVVVFGVAREAERVLLRLGEDGVCDARLFARKCLPEKCLQGRRQTTGR